MGYRILKPLFPLGKVYMTAGVTALELDPDTSVACFIAINAETGATSTMGTSWRTTST